MHPHCQTKKAPRRGPYFDISGTDYFLGGVLALATGPLAYVAFRRKYGGLTKKDAGRYPTNPNTRLATGDTRRLAGIFGFLTAAGLFALFFLPWYEDPAYYAAEYGIDGLFESLISGIRWVTSVFGMATLALVILAKRVEPTG